MEHIAMKIMKRLLLVVIMFAASRTMLAQGDAADAHRTIAQVYDHSLTDLEKEFVPAAEAMPDDKYSFAPTNGEFKGVRTFGSQVKHVAVANYEFAAAILGEKPPIEIGADESGPASIKSKAEILKLLKDSFAYLHKSLNTINQANIVASIKDPFGDGTVTRLGIATMALAHPMDHYGQMVEYLRMNSIIPPASR
jgi:DinB superfamily